MIFGMSLILITWLSVFLAFCGIGLSIHRMFGLKNQNAELISSAFWVGWAFVLILLEVWHFIAPINNRTFLFVMIIGIVSLIYNLKKLMQFFENNILIKLSFFLPLCLFAIWLANRAMGPIGPYDAGLYHLGMIRWISTYPIVPGLGNLLDRFAFNSTYFLFLALLNIKLWGLKAHNLAGGLLLFVFVSQIGLSVSKIVMKEANIQCYDLLRVLLIPPIVHQCFINASGTSYDLPLLIISMAISIQLCKMWFSDESLHECYYSTFFVILLSALGVSIKLNFLILGFFSSLFAFGKLAAYRCQGNSKSQNLKMLIWLILPAAVIIISWMIRGIILSGYVAFPSTYISRDVEWKVPNKDAISMMKTLKSWARQPNPPPDILDNWEWFMPWLKRMVYSTGSRFDAFFPFLLALVGISLIFYSKKRMDKNFYYDMLFLFPPVASLLLLFLKIPNPRYAAIAFWWLGAGAVTVAYKRWGMARLSNSAVVVIMLLSIMFGIATHIKREKFIDSGPQNGFYPIPIAKAHPFTTSSGLTVYVPDEGDQCWDAPLPCTPYPKSNLRLRNDGEIESGFMISSEM